MVRDRLLVFVGGLLSLAAALVLIFAGSRLPFVVVTLTIDEPGLANDFNLARLAVIGLGVGWWLVAYALDLARRARYVSYTGRIGIGLAGLLVVIAGLMLGWTFQHVSDALAAIESMGRLIHGHDELSSDLAALLSESSGDVTAGFCLLLGAMLVLTMSLWSLFWARASAEPGEPGTRWLVWCGIGSAVALAGLFSLATLLAAPAIEQSPPHSTPAFADALLHVRLTLLLVRSGTLALAIYGGALIGFAWRFRTEP